MTRSVWLVDRPSSGREAMLASLRARGLHADASDDAFDVLARPVEPPPHAVLITEHAGPPSAASLARILSKRFAGTAIYRLAELERAPARERFLSPSLGADAIADALAQDAQASPKEAPSLLELAPSQLGALLMALYDARFSGELTLLADGHERAITLLLGLAVSVRSSVPGERLGAVLQSGGAITEATLAGALEQCLDTGARLGEMLVRSGQLSRAELFRALARQTLTRLTHACVHGPCTARLRAQPEAAILARATCAPLLRVHPLTPLLAAATELPQAALTSALGRLEPRKLVAGPSLASTQAFAAELGLALPVLEFETLGSVRAALRPLAGDGLPSADVWLVLLIAADALRVAEPEATRRGVPSMPPPPVGASLLRVLDSRASPSFAGKLVQAGPPDDVSASSSDFEQALEAYLRGSALEPFARERALRGAEAELDRVPVSLLEAVTALGGHALLDLELKPGADAVDIEVAARAKLAGLEALAGDDACARLRMLELSRAIERSRRGLSATASKRVRAFEPPGDTASASTIAPSPLPPRESGEVMTAKHAKASETLAEAEPLVLQGKWSEVLDLLARKHGDPAAMPPALRLLQAVALKEAPASEARAPMVTQADKLGIVAVSELLGVGEDSATALVLAKRTLRRRPIEWQRPPERRMSIVLIVTALAIGALVGLLLGPDAIPLPW